MVIPRQKDSNCRRTIHLIFLFILIVLAGFIPEGNAAGWQYGEEGSDNDWPGLCQTGKYQSPIDLSPSNSAIGKLGTIKFHGYEEAYNGTIRNSGHSLEVKLSSDTLHMSGAGLPDTYKLDHMHFHWKSEHTILGRRFAVECHFVHRNEKYNSVKDAAKHKDGIAVIAALFHVSPEDNTILKPILERAEAVSKWPGSKSDLDVSISPMAFMPDDLTGFYRYRGSLTTPTCDESVVWTVFTDSLPISENQVERFKSLRSEQGPLLVNNRPVKPLKGRLVTYQESQIFLENGSSMNVLINLIISAFSFLICLVL